MSGTNKSSGIKSADSLINTGAAILAGVQIITDKTNDMTLTIYDNTSAAGTVVFKQIVTGTDDSLTYWLDVGTRCKTGIYADMDLAAGTGEYIIFYR